MASGDDQLDFSSTSFNPSRVLSSSDVQLPIPEADEYEDLYKFRDAVHAQNVNVVRELPGVLGPGGIPRPVVRQVPTERNFTEDQGLLRGKGRRRQRNVITRMEEMAGPLKLLKHCRDHSIRVKVYTRNYGEVRGVLSGFVVAFDKHWNLALRDVDEVFQKRLSCKTPALGDISRYVNVGDLSIRESPSGSDCDSDSDGGRARDAGRGEGKRGGGEGVGRGGGGGGGTTQEELGRMRKQEEAEEAARKSFSVTSNYPGTSEAQDARRLALATRMQRRHRQGKEDEERMEMRKEEEEEEEEEEGEVKKRVRKRKKREIRKRHVNQLFVRGENVVLISAVKP